MPKIIIEVGKGQSTDQVLAGLKGQLGLVDGQVTVLADNTRRLEREQRRAESSFRATAASLDPAIAKAQEYAKAEATLGEALKRNIVTQEEHDRLLALARERHDEGSNSLLTYVGRYSAGATAIAAFTLALSGSIAVLDQVQDFLSGSIVAAEQSERIQAQIDARIASTGGAAELTARQLADMANELQNLSKFDDESLAGAQNVLLTFTSISGDKFREALSAVTDMSTALGTDLATNARLVGKALEDPVKGLTALSKAGVVFTADQRAVIESLVESGDLMAAQDKILEALSERYGGAAANDVATFGGSIDRVNNLWDNFQEKVGEGVLPILSAFLTNVGNVIAGNDELAETLGTLVEQAGRLAMVLVSAGADGARAFLEMASTISGALASIAEGAADVYEFLHLDTVADGLRELAKGQRENEEIAGALAKASGQVSDAAFLAAINLGKQGEAAKTGASHSRDHAAADEEAAKEAEAFAKSLRGLLDDLDPVGKAERAAAEGIAILNRALAEGMPVEEYQRQLAALIQRLNDAKVAATGLGGAIQEHAILTIDVDPEDIRRQVREIKPPPEVQATLTLDGQMTAFDEQSAAAAERFAANTEAGLLSAGETFFAEFMSGGDDAWEHLGENLTQVLIRSVSEWLTAQLAAIAKAAIAARAIKAGGGQGYGSASDFVGPAMQNGNFTSMGGGMSAGVGWAAGFAVALAGIYAILKHQDDREHATSYGTSARVSFDNGRLTSSFVGELRETGAAISDGLANVLHELEAATGLWIEGTQKAEIAIRNDKQGFYLKINEEIVGQFNTAKEAMLAAVQHLFSDGQLSGVLDERIRTVINSFQGDDPAKLIENVKAVQQIIDGVSGFSDVQLAIRDLPGYIAETEARLRSMGLSIEDAGELSAQAGAQMRQSIRDQITGHEQTAAEEMAQKQREAAMFNAQLLMDRAEVAAEIEVLKAKQEIALGANQLANADLQMQASYLSAKADLIDDEFRIENGRLVGIAAFNQASAALLAQQIAALEAAQSYLNGIDLIRPEEIHLNRPGSHGGGGAGNVNIPTGPTEAEQTAQDLATLAEQIKGIFQSLSDQDWFAARERLKDQMLEQIELAHGDADALAMINQAYAAQIAALEHDALRSLGLQSVETEDRLDALAQTLEFLRSQGTLTQAQLDELGSNLFGDLLGQMAQAVDDSKTLAMLEEIRFDAMKANARIEIERLLAIGAITKDQYEQLLAYLNNLPDDLPASGGGGGGGGYDNGQDEQLQAQRDLISALEDLADLQRDLWASNLSPLDAEQQTQFLAGQLQEAFNQAQTSGSADDIRAFQDLVRQYLSSYQDAYGSTGGYSAEFLRINGLINSLLAMGNIGGVVPGPGLLGGTAGTGTGGWRPTPGANGTVLPFERTGGPGSPLVVESPALTAIANLAQETNRRLAALEAGVGGLQRETARGNDEAAGRFFMGGRNDAGSSKPRLQRRGA